MKYKISITLSEDLLKAIQQLSKHSKNRSEFIEQALRIYIEERTKSIQDKRDLEILNSHSNRLNKEADDVLSYQIPI